MKILLSMPFWASSFGSNLFPRYLLLLFLIGCGSTEPTDGGVFLPNIDASEDFKSVLFVGNSYTAFHSMPEMVRQMAISSSRTLIYEQHSPPSTFVSDHAESSELEGKLDDQKWDFVTIQAQSLEPVLAAQNMDDNVYPSIMTLVDKIKSNSETSTPLFFMTWGREDGDSSLCGPLPDVCTFDGMTDRLKERYLFYMNSSDGEVSPCAELWRVLRERYPDLDLYEEDGSHPNVLGSYAIALSFHTMIFKFDPTLVTYHRSDLDINDEELIREVVKEVVFDQITQWQAN